MNVKEILIQKGGFREFEKTDRYAYAGASENAVIRHANYVDYVWSEDILYPLNPVNAIFNFRCGNETTQCYFFINSFAFVDWDALVTYIDNVVYEGLKRANTLKEVEAYVKEVLGCIGYELNF